MGGAEGASRAELFTDVKRIPKEFKEQVISKPVL